jgi:hypothetical protein
MRVGSKASTAKLTEKQVREIRLTYDGRLQHFCKKYKVTANPMARLIAGLNWKHVRPWAAPYYTGKRAQK